MVLTEFVSTLRLANCSETGVLTGGKIFLFGVDGKGVEGVGGWYLQWRKVIQHAAN